MRSNNYKSVLKHAGLAATVLLLASGVAFGQQVNLTAAGTTTTLPDGSVVPMWGYSCDAVQPTGSTATCAALNTTVPAGSWSPVVITVPTGTDLQINLTNNLSFGTAPNNIPTSLVIVGQLGGGLGTPGSSTASPDHTKAQPVTWPLASDGAVRDPGGDDRPERDHRGHGLRNWRHRRHLQRRHPAAAQRDRPGAEPGGRPGGWDGGIQRDQRVVGPVRRLRQSVEREWNCEYDDLRDLLSAGRQLHPGVLPVQRPRFRQDKLLGLAVCGCAGLEQRSGHRPGAGAPGQCRPAHARAVDRRCANRRCRCSGYHTSFRIFADRRGRQRAARRGARAERSIHARGQDQRCADQRSERHDGPADL